MEKTEPVDVTMIICSKIEEERGRFYFQHIERPGSKFYHTNTEQIAWTTKSSDGQKT